MPSEILQVSEDDFQEDLRQLKNLSAHDRDVILTSFRQHAARLVEAQVRPRIDEMLRASATQTALRDAAISTLVSANLPQRLDKVEGKIDELRTDVSSIRSVVAGITERLKHMPTKVELYIAMASLLGVMAKGFGWL